MLATNYSLTNHIYIYKQDLALNDPQGFICHKTRPNQKTFPYISFIVKQSTEQNFPNKAQPGEMGTRTWKLKRGGSLNLTTSWSDMADSCLYI